MAQVSVLRWEFVDDLLITCSTAGEIDDGVLRKLVDELRASSVTRVFSISLGSASMTSVQRREVAQLSKQKGLDSVVLTDSAVNRGLLTAMSWFGASISALPLSAHDEAFEALGVSGPLLERARDTVTRLRAEVDAERRSSA